MVDFYKSGDDETNRRLDAITKAEEDASWAGYSTFTGKDPLSVREQEEESVSPKMPNYREMTNAQRAENKRTNQDKLYKKLFLGKKLRKRTSVGAILLALLGGGSLLSVFFSPSLAIINMKEVLTKGLNDQMHSVDERSAVLMRAKLKDLTKGSCGAIKIKCRFATISETQVEKFKAAGIEMDIDKSVGFGSKRGQITEIRFTDDKDNKTVITSAAELQKTLLDADKQPFRAAMLKGYNPLFAGLSDKVSLSVLRVFKASKGLVATGDSDKERQEKVNDAVSGVDDTGAKSIITKTDDDGKEHYYDSDTGQEISKDEMDVIKKQGDRISTYATNGGYKGMLTSLAKGASILGYVDTACTAFNSIRMVAALAKTVREAQEVRYAMAMVLTPADSIKAGDATEGDVNFVGNTLAATRPPGQVVDESKIMLASSSQPIPTTNDSEAGKSAYDSPAYRMVAYNEVPDISLRASQYMLGGTSTALSGALSAVSVMITGNSDPQAVSEKCGWVQNPIVRLGGLAISVAASVGTLGLTTALSVGGSFAVAMLLPYAESQAADMVAGNVLKGITGIDSGDVAVMGSTAFFGRVAQRRGLEPLSAKKALEYAAANQASYSEYAQTQQYIAKAAPFDINNPYSFLGSLAGTMTPLLQKSQSSASMAMMNLASLIPTAFASLTGTAKAADVKPGDYYSKCNDVGYARLGLGADAFCGIHYGLSSEELAIDPLDNVQWMVDNQQIDPDTGEAKEDDGSDWNYSKFLIECANRTVGWGENQDENQGDGSNCISDKNAAKNKHYRIYTLDKSVDESMDGELVSV